MVAERCVQDSKAVRAELENTFERDLRVRRDTLTCSKGCHHCCYNPFLVSILEGISIYRWLAENRMWSTTLKAKFEAHHDAVLALSPEVWLLSQIPCPLLDGDKGICKAYEGRPFACRVTASTGDPYYCHPHRLVRADGIVPRLDVLSRLASKDAAILQRLRTVHALMPFSTAVLYGERITKGDMSIEDYPRQVGAAMLERA